MISFNTELHPARIRRCIASCNIVIDNLKNKENEIINYFKSLKQYEIGIYSKSGFKVELCNCTGNISIDCQKYRIRMNPVYIQFFEDIICTCSVDFRIDSTDIFNYSLLNDLYALSDENIKYLQSIWSILYGQQKRI